MSVFLGTRVSVGPGEGTAVAYERSASLKFRTAAKLGSLLTI